MESAMANLPFARYAGRAGDLRLLAAELVEAVVGDDQGFFPAVAAPIDRFDNRPAFEVLADARNIVEVVERDRRDAKAAIGFLADQPVGGKPRQRFPQRAGAHPVTLMQLGKPQPAAGGEDAKQDVRLETREDRIGQRAAGVAFRCFEHRHRRISPLAYRTLLSKPQTTLDSGFAAGHDSIGNRLDRRKSPAPALIACPLRLAPEISEVTLNVPWPAGAVRP
jgi:hypothetical protein